MIFTLEALKAKHGDSLLLHYGTKSDPKLMVIDGGPAGVYKESLLPRLLQIKKKLSPGEALPLQLVMVSHLDDDHINGLLQMSNELVRQKEKGEDSHFEVLSLWNNTFDDIIGNTAAVALSSLVSDVQAASVPGGSLPAGIKLSQPGMAVIQSIGQGRKLRDNAEELDIEVNSPFTGLVRGKDTGKSTVKISNELRLHILGPRDRQVEELHDKWDAELKKVQAGGDASVIAAAFLDESAFNLSSIVVLAEFEDVSKSKTMLLTGDARGDFILDGLDAGGFLKGGKVHVDLLKVPHHGSDRNVEIDFFRKVTADHYVISGDGEHGNPETATLDMICTARGKSGFTIYMTYRSGKKNLKKRLDAFLKRKPKSCGVEFLPDGQYGIKVNLLDRMTY